MNCLLTTSAFCCCATSFSPKAYIRACLLGPSKALNLQTYDMINLVDKLIKVPFNDKRIIIVDTDRGFYKLFLICSHHLLNKFNNGIIVISFISLHDSLIVVGGMIIIHVASNTKQNNLATVVELFVALTTKITPIVCVVFSLTYQPIKKKNKCWRLPSYV